MKAEVKMSHLTVTYMVTVEEGILFINIPVPFMGTVTVDAGVTGLDCFDLVDKVNEVVRDNYLDMSLSEPVKFTEYMQEGNAWSIFVAPGHNEDFDQE